MLLAGAFAAPGAGQATPPSVEDPPDDAREQDVTSPQVVAATVCRAGFTTLREACTAVNGQGPPTQGNLPAPATMEAISASFADSPETLTVMMELAEVSAQFEGAVARDPTTREARGAIYRVCWTTSETPCTESVVLGAIPDPSGAPALTAYYAHQSVACNDRGTCAWRVPITLEEGTPGRIVWSVPRAILANASAGTILDAPSLAVERYIAPTGEAPWPSDSGYGYGVSGPPVETEQTGEVGAARGYSSNHVVLVDSSDPGTPYPLATTAAAVDVARGFTFDGDPPEDVAGPAREDIDVLGVALLETDTNLTVATEVARVDEAPIAHYLFGALGLASGRYYTYGYGIVDGELQPHAEVCAVPQCHQMPVPDLRTLPVDITIVPGTPGWINATFARTDLGEPARGDIVNFLRVTMFTYQDQSGDPLSEAPVRPPVGAAFVASGSTDTTGFAPPWWFTLDTAKRVETSSFVIKDDLGDVDGTAQTRGFENRFDITYVEAVGRTPGSSRVTIGIADLSHLEEVPGSRGFTYVAGFQLTDGTSRMVGFYFSRDMPGSTPQREFFCAEDTAVFAPTPRDPAEVLWTKIEGLVSVASEIDTTGAGQRGSLTFLVPHESCFGQLEAGPLHIAAAGARTYLLPRANELGQVESLGFQPLDVAESDEAFTLQATEIIPPGPPWYAEPFGIAAFWDIFGITVVPLLASLIGLLALRRRRRILERYLKLIDTTIATNEGKPKELEAALSKIRHQLKEDLVRDRIQHGHFTIADKRIEEARGKARVSNIAEAFEELPHRLLRRLEELLADGLMSREDYRVFSALLEEAPLTPDARASIRRKLLIWVREDAEEAKTRTVPVDAGSETKRPATLN